MGCTQKVQMSWVTPHHSICFCVDKKRNIKCDNIILVKQKCVTLGMLKYTYSSEIWRFYEYRKESKNGVKLGINVRGGNF